MIINQHQREFKDQIEKEKSPFRKKTGLAEGKITDG